MDRTQPKILIVEDDTALAGAIARNLAADGYTARSAGSVHEASTSLHGGCPLLVVLDIDLPDGSGWDVLRSLRATGCSGTRVIVVSALRPNPRLATELGCFAVLEKPFPMESLLRLIVSSLDPKRPGV